MNPTIIEQRLDNVRKDDNHEYFLNIGFGNIVHTTKIVGTAAANAQLEETLELLSEGHNRGVYWLKIGTSAVKLRDISFVSLEEAE